MAEKGISKVEAQELLRNWANFMELDTDRELFSDIVDELCMVVKLEKLTFDEESETFKLVLRYPVKDKNIIEIKACDMAAKRVLQKYKDNESIDSARAMLAAYTGLEESEVRLLKDLDINRINAVICGFIQQVQPGKK